jgi:hypothetical protein
MARRPTEPTANPARGAALVVVAVLIGLFLLRNGLDSSSSSSGSDGSESSSDSGQADEGTDEATDDTTPSTVGLRSPADVPTIVLNGSGVTGAAGRYSQALAALNPPYNLTDENGADATSSVTATQILYAPGFDREAAVVATVIGAPPTVVPQPLGTTQPGVINGAQVVVILGPDIADRTPPSATG